jgi:cytochrome c
MKLTPIAVALVAGLSASGAAHADAAKAATLMKGSDCMACHAEATKLVGPSYKDVAKKYAGNAGAGDMLVKKIWREVTHFWSLLEQHAFLMPAPLMAL